jgi:starvation-inducible DNA-binding protein
MNIGLEENERKAISAGLSALLADSYTLLLKTQNFHWNVRGSNFQELHSLFETQYHDLVEAVDLIAERIRALGYYAPATFAQFNQLKTISEDAGEGLPSPTMIAQLIEGHEAISSGARKLSLLTNQHHDEATLEILTERMKAHEKAAWMLRSLLA